MNKLTRTLTTASLIAALGAVGLTGCGSDVLDGTKTVAAVGDDTVTLGTANIMLRMTQAQIAPYYAMFGGSSAGIWEQEGEDGKTYGESEKEEIMEQIHDMLLLKQHASDYDVTVTEEDKEKMTEAAKQFMEDNDAQTISKLAVSQSDIEALLELYTYRQRMYDPMTADVDTNVEDAEAAQSRITYCKISTEDTKDEDGNDVELTDEEKQAKKEQAQTILDKVNAQEEPASADMDALAKEVDESLSASSTTYGSDDTLLDDTLKEAASALEDGQVASEVVEGEDAYFVVRMDSVLDEEATQTKKDSIVSNRKQEAYQKLLDTWEEETDIKIEEKVWKKVKLTDKDNYTFKEEETEAGQ